MFTSDALLRGAQEVRATLRAADGDGWLLVAGTAGGAAAELVHAGAAAPPPEAPLFLASASKWVNAAVILRLVDEGLLSLDDTPQRWLGEAGFGAGATDARRNITLRHLLSLTSGLPSGVAPPCDWLRCGSDADAFVAVDAPAPLACCVRSAAASSPQLFGPGPPGRVFNYNGLNLDVAGAMAEAAANASFAELFSRALQPRLRSAARHVVASPQASALGGGGLVMSPLDYGTFLRTALVPRSRGGLLSAPTLAAMLSPAHTADVRMNGTLEALTGAPGWRYGLGLWLEQNATIASSLGFQGLYPRANLSSGAYAVLVPSTAVARDDAAAERGVLMRSSVQMMERIWAPLQRALADAERSGAPAPAKLREDATEDDACAEEDDAGGAAAADVSAVAAQAQRAALERAGGACSAALAGRTRVRVTVHGRFSDFVSSRAAAYLCRNNTLVVHAQAFADTLLADVPAHFVPKAFAAGVAASPRLWLKLKRAAAVAAAAGGVAASACADAPPLRAADLNAATKAAAAPGAAIAFADDMQPDNWGPAWLAAPAVELRNASAAGLLVRSPSLTTPLSGVPAAVAGSVLIKVIAPAAMRRLMRHTLP